MSRRITITKTINAPAEKVFKTVSDINHFSKAVPHIVSAEILSVKKSGVGTRFRETRVVKGTAATTELEVTEYVENDRVRIVTDSHGTVWDTLFVVRPAQGRTELELTMHARAHKLLPKLLNPLIRGAVSKAVEDDMDAVKAYCETSPEEQEVVDEFDRGGPRN